MRCGPAGLRFELSQLSGDCFAFYIRTPEMWNGLRAIYHVVDEGPCSKACEPNCHGYNEQAAGAVYLITKWLEQAMPKIMPSKLDRKPLDQIIADIAAGMKPTKPTKRRRDT